MFYSQKQEKSEISESLISEINYLQSQKQQKLEKLEVNNDNEKDNSTHKFQDCLHSFITSKQFELERCS